MRVMLFLLLGVAAAHARICPAGTYVDGKTGVCKPCPNEFYQPTPTEDYRCKICTRCDGPSGSSETSVCMATADRKCACRAGFVPLDTDSSTCQCPKGHDYDFDVCVPCPPNTFNPVPDQPCRPMKACANGVAVEGTPTEDRICAAEVPHPLPLGCDAWVQNGDLFRLSCPVPSGSTRKWDKYNYVLKHGNGTQICSTERQPPTDKPACTCMFGPSGRSVQTSHCDLTKGEYICVLQEDVTPDPIPGPVQTACDVYEEDVASRLRFRDDAPKYQTRGGWLCDFCPPGHSFRGDCLPDRPDTTVCQVCPAGHYSEWYNCDYYCRKCDECPPGYFEFSPCRPDENRICQQGPPPRSSTNLTSEVLQCSQSTKRCPHGKWTPDGKTCVAHTPCGPEELIIIPGTGWHDNVCRSCYAMPVDRRMLLTRWNLTVPLLRHFNTPPTKVCIMARSASMFRGESKQAVNTLEWPKDECMSWLQDHMAEVTDTSKVKCRCEFENMQNEVDQWNTWEEKLQFAIDLCHPKKKPGQ